MGKATKERFGHRTGNLGLIDSEITKYAHQALEGSDETRTVLYGNSPEYFFKRVRDFWRENDVLILMWSEECWKPLSSGGDEGYFIGLFQPDEFREIRAPSNFEELKKRAEEVWNGLVRYDLLDREWRYLQAFDTLVEKENVHSIPIELVVREVSDGRVSRLDGIIREFAESNRKS